MNPELHSSLDKTKRCLFLSRKQLTFYSKLSYINTYQIAQENLFYQIFREIPFYILLITR